MEKYQGSALLVLRERTTLTTTSELLKGTDSKIVQEKISDRISRKGKSWIKIMTLLTMEKNYKGIRKWCQKTQYHRFH